MNDRFLTILFDKDEVTWQTMLYELVKTEQMDPWDIDIKLIARKFLETLSKMKELDFRISGKIILAAAIMLKIKSIHLLENDISNLDRLFADEPAENLLDEIQDFYEEPIKGIENAVLIPKMPQPRKRKVSIFDLVNALQQAIEVKRRRVMRSIPPLSITEIPEKKIDISSAIKNIYTRVKLFFFKNSNGKLTFSQLVPSESKLDRVYTFIPLLHLTNQSRIDMLQQEHFGEIEIRLLQAATSHEADKELNLDSNPKPDVKVDA